MLEVAGELITPHCLWHYPLSWKLNASYTKLYVAPARPPSLLQVSYTSPSVIMSFVLDVTSELRRTYIYSHILCIGYYKWVTPHCLWSCAQCWMLTRSYTTLSVVMSSELDVNKELHHTVCGHVLSVER